MMTKEQKYDATIKIYNILKGNDCNWYGWRYWEYRDDWFKQFDPKEVEQVAQEMADLGMIETNNRGGFRRKEKSFREKFWTKVWGD